MIRYLIFVIFGILLFVFLNHKDGFSIGIPIWLIDGRGTRVLATDPSIQLPLLSAGGGNEEENLRLQVDDFLRTPYATDDRGRVVGGRGHYQIYTAPCEGVPPNLRIPPGIRGGDFEVTGMDPAAEPAAEPVAEPAAEPVAEPAAETDAETRALALQRRQELVRNREIGKLYTEVCSRVNEMFLEQDEPVRRDITKKIVEAILAFIGESDEPIQIIKGMEVATLIPGMIGLPDACAALVIQCLDIPETNDIPLDILLKLLHLIIIKFQSGQRNQLFLRDQRDQRDLLDIINHLTAELPLLIRLAQAIIKFQQRGNRIVIDIDFIDFIKLYISDKYMNNVNNCYKFLWIYTHKHEHEGVVVDINELEELDGLYRFMGGRPDFCDDSGD